MRAARVWFGQVGNRYSQGRRILSVVPGCFCAAGKKPGKSNWIPGKGAVAKKRLSSCAVKSASCAGAVKILPVFPIQGMWRRAGAVWRVE